MYQKIYISNIYRRISWTKSSSKIKTLYSFYMWVKSRESDASRFARYSYMAISGRQHYFASFKFKYNFSERSFIRKLPHNWPVFQRSRANIYRPYFCHGVQILSLSESWHFQVSETSGTCLEGKTARSYPRLSRGFKFICQNFKWAWPRAENLSDNEKILVLYDESTLSNFI